VTCSSRWIVAVAIGITLVACSPQEPQTTGTQTPAECPSFADTVSAARPMVHVTNRCSHRSADVSGPTPIANGTAVVVQAVGALSGLADIAFPGVGTCRLEQLQPPKSARLVNRPHKGELFWQFRGRTLCTTHHSVSYICGTRDVFASVLQESDVAQSSCSSDPDPALSVAVFRGLLEVTVDGRPTMVGQNQEFDILTGSIHEASFTDEALRVFGQQGGESVQLDVTTTGSGTIQALPGIDCGVDCFESYTIGSVVTLTAVPAAGWEFASWGGACEGTTATCQLAMNDPKAVEAIFQPSTTQEPQGTLAVATSGPGVVVSRPVGITCGSDCEQTYTGGSVTLVATPSEGAVFAGWSGDCSGFDSICTLSMTAPRSVSATFASCTIVPTEPSVVGTAGDDVICASSFTVGTTIDGLAGNDIIVGGAGNDSLSGGEGNDIVLGGAGDDAIQGDDGNDLIEGGGGNDVLVGGAGTDTCTNGESTSECE
jgi:hypothetical protein